jgi:chemotaxis protein methyltransferase CheR
MRWPGFRKVRRQVCKRIARRLEQLNLADLRSYRSYLEAHAQEWAVLDQCCRITISRFLRDRRVFQILAAQILPVLARRQLAAGLQTLDCWSAGCASGEEPYTLALLWAFQLRERFPALALRVLATDADGDLLQRARRGLYPPSALRELPLEWRERAFTKEVGAFRLHADLRQAVTLQAHDVRLPPPGGLFPLVMCRNLAFTYFAKDLQQEVLRKLAGVLPPGGVLVVGAREELPAEAEAFVPLFRRAGIYQKRRSTGGHTSARP